MAKSGRSPLIYALGGMVTMAVAMGIGRFVYTPILPGMMDELGLSASAAGWIASSNYAGYLLGAFLAAGNWGQGREYPVALLSLLATAILTGAMAYTGNVPAFLVIRFLAGLASAFAFVFLSTIVFGRLAQAGRPDLQAVHFSGVGVGIATSSLMIAALGIAHAGWQAGWIWAAILAAMGFVAVALLIDREPASATRVQAEPPLPRTPAMLRIIVGYGLFGFGYIVTATFLVAIVRQGQMGSLFEALVWCATGLAIIPSVLVWNLIARRTGRVAAYSLACLVEAAGVIASVAIGGHAGPLIGGVLLGSTFVAITALGLQVAREIAVAAPRRAVALMTAAFGLGQIIGPIVAGFITDRTGTFTFASLIAAATLVAAALVVGRRG